MSARARRADRRGAARRARRRSPRRGAASSASSSAPRPPRSRPTCSRSSTATSTASRRRLAGAGFTGRFSVMQSNGGPPARRGDAAQRHHRAVLRPGGRRGRRDPPGRALAARGDLITFDMGGTSTDVCLVQRRRAGPRAPETEVDGLPIRTPVLDIVSVGAGGGSHRLDRRRRHAARRPAQRRRRSRPGLLRQAAAPQPTVTDAHVVRGTIRPDSLPRRRA